MSNKTVYQELYAFHPGYYIAEIIEDLEIDNQEEFARRMGTTPKTLSQLVNGKCNLTKDLAMKLAAMTGSSVSVWLNLQKAYDEKLLEIQDRKAKEQQTRIVQMIDYSYFVKVAGLPKARGADEKIRNLCGYLKVSDLAILSQPDFLANFRSGVRDVQEKNVVNAQAWLQTAMNFARLSPPDSEFSAEKLKAALPEIRSMTVQAPDTFLPRLREIFSDCGVSFVLLPHLKNSGVNGAVKWYGRHQVLLAMNDRRRNADTFWFSLFHEIKHVLQMKSRTVFLTGDDISNPDEKLEREADEFARDFLIPPKEYRAFRNASGVTDGEIIAFAKRIGVHPGIVAGRLQHDGVIPYTRCADLREPYQFSFS